MSVTISPAEERFAKSPGCEFNMPEGVVWKVKGSEGNPPYLYASCSHCKQSMDTESADPKYAVFKHCVFGSDDGSSGVSYPPKELVELLVKVQIQRGDRRAPSLKQRLIGEVPALVKIF